MMIRKMPKWMAGIALVLAVGAAPLACGGGSGDQDMGGAPSDEDGTGGKNTDGSGGKNTGGSGGGDTDGAGGNNTDGDGGEDNGSGGNTSGDASIDDLISAICEWEYGCCDDGEVTYRLGTAAGQSVEDCVEYFTFQLHESNTTDNPFPGGTAGGLLGTLAYAVNLDRVVENGDGIAACIDAYNDMGCPTEAPEGPAYCEEGQAPDEDPCALVNLFGPALEEGDRCTIALAEGGTNDVECPAGTTCLPAGGDNPEDFPICVQRGTDEQPCTEDADCDYNFYCAPDSKCTEKGDIGDDCTFNDDDPTPGDEDASCKAGLACDPIELVCVNSCTENFPCIDNVQCPEGYGCAPIQVGNDSSTWLACLALGTENADRCNDDNDCAANRYCDGANCRADVDTDDDCTKNEMCPNGNFCDVGVSYDAPGYAHANTAVCTALAQAGETCLIPGQDGVSNGCSPSAPFCISVSGVWECSASLHEEGDDCYDMLSEPLNAYYYEWQSECEAGLRCETTAVGEYTCTTGAELGDDCDDDYTDDEFLNCGAGLTCKDECVEQVGPGEDCENQDTEGTADGALCTNSACVENWDENGPDFICTDAPVPESNGGDDLTCGE